MRHKLADHLYKYVLCRGWIGDWEDIDDCSTRRVFVKQPTIKEANKDLLYDDQETISTEHHLNLFIRYEDLPNYDTIFELNSPIKFSGIIEEYTRANGTIDYGIYATKQSTLHFKLERLLQSVQETMDKQLEAIEQDYLKSAIRQVSQLTEELKKGGEQLPTFNRTYEEFHLTLVALGYALPQSLRRTREILGSRSYRRSQQKRRTAIEEADLIPTKKKRTKKEKQDLIRSIGELG